MNSRKRKKKEGKEEKRKNGHCFTFGRPKRAHVIAPPTARFASRTEWEVRNGEQLCCNWKLGQASWELGMEDRIRYHEVERTECELLEWNILNIGWGMECIDRKGRTGIASTSSHKMIKWLQILQMSWPAVAGECRKREEKRKKRKKKEE